MQCQDRMLYLSRMLTCRQYFLCFLFTISSSIFFQYTIDVNRKIIHNGLTLVWVSFEFKDDLLHFGSDDVSLFLFGIAMVFAFCPLKHIMGVKLTTSISYEYMSTWLHTSVILPILSSCLWLEVTYFINVFLAGKLMLPYSHNQIRWCEHEKNYRGNDNAVDISW